MARPNLDTMGASITVMQDNADAGALLNILGTDTVIYDDGSNVRIGVHFSAKRIVQQMNALVQLVESFPDRYIDVMGDFNAVLSLSSATSLAVHPKDVAEASHSEHTLLGEIDFRRQVAFQQIPVDSSCKRRWDSSQGSKVAQRNNFKIDFIFRLLPKDVQSSVDIRVRVLEHGHELNCSRPPDPFYPADHFEVEAEVQDEVLRTWNVCGESITSNHNDAGEHPSGKCPDSRNLTIPPNCFEFLTPGADSILTEETNILEAREAVIDSMPSLNGISFRDRLNGSKDKDHKANEFSTVLRNCPPLDVHFAPFLCGPADASDADVSDGELQMRLLGRVWAAADSSYRRHASEAEIELYDQWMEFKRRCFEDPVIQHFLTRFFAEVVSVRKIGFLDVILPLAKTQAFHVWALQEVSDALQRQIDEEFDLLQEYGYVAHRLPLQKEGQKTWGVLLIRRPAPSPALSTAAVSVDTQV